MAPGLESGMTFPHRSLDKLLDHSKHATNVSQLSLLDLLSGEQGFDLPESTSTQDDKMVDKDITAQVILECSWLTLLV